MLLNHAWATIKARGLVLHSLSAAWRTLKPWQQVKVKARRAQVLRDTLNCTLPIEIIYNGPLEMDAWAIQKFEVGMRQPLRDSACALSPAQRLLMWHLLR